MAFATFRSRIFSHRIILGVTVVTLIGSVSSYCLNLVPKRDFVLFGTSNGIPLALGENDAPCSQLRRGKAITVKISATFLSGNPYQIIFQTADQNQGMRVELGPAGELGFLSSALTTSGVYSTPLGNVAPGESFQLSIEISNRSLSVFENNPERSFTYFLPELVPRCDKWVIGSGFDGTRTFVGPTSISLRINGVSDQPWVRELRRWIQNDFVRLIQLLLTVHWLSLAILQFQERHKPHVAPHT